MSRKFIRRFLRGEIPFRAKRRKRPRRVHVNKYVHLRLRVFLLYDSKNKRFRNLPLSGNAGEVVQSGIIVIYHGRRYKLLAPAKILEDGYGNGRFELCRKSSI